MQLVPLCQYPATHDWQTDELPKQVAHGAEHAKRQQFSVLIRTKRKPEQVPAVLLATVKVPPEHAANNENSQHSQLPEQTFVGPHLKLAVQDRQVEDVPPQL